ncbi:MAG: sulfatase-like hydrolase/transferase [Puniceicoccales bacterium]|jgi:phosphoglycerol transferase MdoB-like AlkP superfamily enzyme|nr:sulfatase-like hydrolase/transferase [Puniceicoccales bacterium]
MDKNVPNVEKPFVAPWSMFIASFVFMLFVLWLSHLSLIASFADLLKGVTTYNLSMFVRRAWQFDCRIGGMLIFPFFVTSLFFCKSERLQKKLSKFLKFVVALFTCITVILAVIEIGYFKEYNDRFNFWVFNFLFDDRKAILSTIKKSYNLLGVSAIIIFVSAGLTFFYRKLVSKITLEKHRNAWTMLIFTLFIGTFLIVAARGSASSRPLEQVDVAITGNKFLNKCVPNAYYAIYFAWKDFLHSNDVKCIQKSCSREHVRAALMLLGSPTDDIDRFISHTANGAKLSRKPKHIFLIVMESQDNWPFLPENSELNLCPNLARLAKEGLYFKNFVPTGQGTMSAIAVQMCNYPNMGFLINYSKNGLENCELSVGTLFQRLGYATNFYYAGYLSWQRIDRFAPIHGYQHCYGGDVMGTYEGNEWGVNDKDLFAFVERNFSPDTDDFNLILTASNHSPYSVDLVSEGVPLEHIAKYVDGQKKVKYLGHAWYADRCVGDFIGAIEKLTDDAIFVITGDHFSRKHRRSQFSLFDEWTVPLIIYGKNFNEELKRYLVHAGSQVDIVRTIVELVAEKGFDYASFGKDLLSDGEICEGYCTGVTITDKYIVTNDNKNIGMISDCSTSVSESEREGVISRNHAWQTLAKWKFFHF